MTPQRKTLLLLALILVFLGPLGVAYILYKTGYHPLKTTQQGELIKPFLLADQPLFNLNHEPFNTSLLLNHWVLLYRGDGHCEKDCQTILANMEHLLRVLGKHKNKVKLLWAGNEEILDIGLDEFLKYYPNLIVAIVEKNTIQPLYFYLVDPNGTIMMKYAPDVDPQAIVADLKKLLKYSPK